MANILPPDRLKALRKAQRARLLFATGCVGIVTGSMAFAALLPSFLAVRMEPQAAHVARDIKNATSTNALVEAQNLVAILEPLSASTTTSMEIVRAAIVERPASVRIDHIEYTGGASGRTLVLSGTSGVASDIEVYRTRLVGSGYFTQVNVPVSVLAGASNGRFTITLTGRL